VNFNANIAFLTENIIDKFDSFIEAVNQSTLVSEEIIAIEMNKVIK